MTGRAKSEKVAAGTIAKFAEFMQTWNQFSFHPGAACILCQNVTAAVKVSALAAGLTEKQVVEAVKMAKPLFADWLKNYIDSGKGVIAARRRKKL